MPRTTRGHDDDDGGSAAIRVRSKVWIERGGLVVVSEYRARLLRAVADEGSVARAATTLGLPNRTAWKKLREMERATGLELLRSDSGGAGGGGTRLTPEARALLDAFSRVADPVAGSVGRRFERDASAFG
jgi:molybdate transport system regulatory protein